MAPCTGTSLLTSPRHRATHAFFVVVLTLGSVDAHGNLNLPLPRNNVGQFPADTPPGASSGPSCLGDACGWFQAGCFIGCPYCSNASSGADVPSYPSTDASTANCTVLAPTLPDELRTYNREGLSPFGDWTASHPWRAPGRAPMHDACGLSGAYSVGPGVSGYAPLYPGSKIPAQQSPTTWAAGGVAEVGWSLWSNHGGGYVYRLCAKGRSPSEECFQEGILSFADDQTVVRSPFGKFDDFSIDAMDVDVGTHPKGSVWRRNPIPACSCDKGYNCTVDESDPAYWPYRNETSGDHPCGNGYQFPPPWDVGFGYWGSGAHYSGDRLLFQMVDRLRVPVEKGEYLLSWRWDCENSPQIWGNCADIVVV